MIGIHRRGAAAWADDVLDEILTRQAPTQVAVDVGKASGDMTAEVTYRVVDGVMVVDDVKWTVEA